MKLKHLLVIAVAGCLLALTGCGMKGEEAVKLVQEKLDEAAEAMTDQEVQDLILEGAPWDLAGLPAEDHADLLAGIRSKASVQASSAEKTEDGFTVTVDVTPVTFEFTEEEVMEACRNLLFTARDQGLSPEDLKGDAFRQTAAETFLSMAAGKAAPAESFQDTADITAKGEMDEKAVPDILKKTFAFAWPAISEETLTGEACVILYDLPGTYLGRGDLTEKVSGEVDKTFGVESEGTLLMDLYLVLNDDYTMDFYADTAQFVQATREYYDKNLDKWFGSMGTTVEKVVQAGQYSSRQEILDSLLKSAGYDAATNTLPAVDNTAYSGTWHFEDGAVVIDGTEDRFVRQEDGSLVSFFEDKEISFVKQ
jgi:hypothetical protein